MLGLIGIIGCIGAVGAAVAVVGTVVATGVSISMNEQAKDAAEKQAELQQQAMDKAEDQARADKVIQKKLVQRNLLQARQTVGTSIAYEKLLAAKTARKAAKTHGQVIGNSEKPKKAVFNSHNMGSPSQSA